MDISPLPHKQPFSFVHEVHVQSPTPEPSPDEEMISPCDSTPTSSFQIHPDRLLEYVAICYTLLLLS